MQRVPDLVARLEGSHLGFTIDQNHDPAQRWESFLELAKDPSFGGPKRVGSRWITAGGVFCWGGAGGGLVA